MKKKLTTDVTPSEYIKIINARELEEEDKLPAEVMNKWKEANDQANFSARIENGLLSNFSPISSNLLNRLLHDITG